VKGPFVVELLSSAHDRTQFHSGVEALDRYFREQVTQDLRRRTTHCFVALGPERVIAGYYIFAAASLPINELTDDETKRLPHYPVLPAGLIGRLAVDQRLQGQGLGGALIVDAIERAGRAEPAIFTLIVDAKDENALDFYQNLGFRPFTSRPMSLFLPIAEALRRLNSSR
jgi:ribosomal protein S18 acetylase RimI-like enzyme